jgi:hypothetical protein
VTMLLYNLRRAMTNRAEADQGSELRLTKRKKCVAHASFDGDWFHTRTSYAPGRPPNCSFNR